MARNRRKQDFLLTNRIVFEFCFKSIFRRGEVYRKIFIFFSFSKMLTAFSVSVKKISLVELIKKVALYVQRVAAIPLMS